MDLLSGAFAAGSGATGGCGPYPDPTCQLALRLAHTSATSVLDGLGSWVAAGASWLLDSVGRVLAAAATPQLDAVWFGREEHAVALLAGLLALPLLLLAALQAVVRQDLAGLARTVVVRLPLAFLLGAAAVQLVALGVALADGMSQFLADAVGLQPAAVLHRLANLFPAAIGPAPGFITLCVALLLAAAALVLWLELAVRAAAIEMATLFLPLALAGLIWPATAVWARRLAETLAALVLSKVVMVAVLAAGVGALLEGGGTGLDGVAAGVALLILATFAPFALLRLMPFVEAGAVSQLDGLSRRALAAVPVPSAALSGVLARAAGSEAPEAPPMAVGGAAPASFHQVLADGLVGAATAGPNAPAPEGPGGSEDGDG